MLATSFPPVSNPRSRVLILGSMPGIRSLQEQQYYAQPRNVFWNIMGELFSAGRELPYSERLDALRANGVALWDVLRSCERPGSLDASIVAASAEANDFDAFFASQQKIHTIFFNGKTAQLYFMRKVASTLSRPFDDTRLIGLPSTSPAHAAMSYEDKLEQWSTAMNQAIA